MDPYLKIIKYLFKKKGIDNIDNSIDEFFENGLSFPQFISIIFNVDEIPKINKNPKTLFHKKMNNDIAFQFLCQKNAIIGKLNPSYNSEREKMNLLLLVFTKQCFKININEIISKCNLISQSLNIKFEKKKDIISPNCLLSLLNILSDGKVQFDKSLDVNKNFDEIMSHCFSQANAPLVINKSSLDIQNQNIFLIQIEILFDYYSDKINQIQSNNNSNANQNMLKQPIQQIQNQQTTQNVSKLTKQTNNESQNNDIFTNIESNQLVQKEIQDDQEEEEEDIGEEIEEDQIDINFENIDWKKIDEKKKKKPVKIYIDDDYYSEYDDISYQYILEEALLKTMNVIGQGKFHFNNFHDSVKNDTIPRFVMFYLNLKSIKGVRLKPFKTIAKDHKITKEELNNINFVIKFLGTKEIRFKFLKFDFKNRATEESSAVLFYSSFLNSFFVKSQKRDIYERCAILLCTKKRFINFNDFEELKSDRTFVALLHFFTEKNLHFEYYDLPNIVDSLAPNFEKANIPLIITSKTLDYRYRDNQISDSIFYQLQLIFNAIDSGPKSLVVLERLLRIIYNLQKLTIPPYDEIAGSILAKRTSIEFQNASFDQYLKHTDSKNLSESLSSLENIPFEPITNPYKVNTYRTRQQGSKQNFQNSNIKTKIQTPANINEKFEKLLISNESNFKFKNGVIYDITKDQNRFQQDWIKEIINIKKITKEEVENITQNDLPNKETKRFYLFKNSFDSKLYKVFIFDETNENWAFQSDVFQQFAADKHINNDDEKTPIILILDSNKNDSIMLINNLFNGIHPKLDNEQDIFIYSLCDKTLSMLNFNIDCESKKKSKIKPIFLLLHIPQAKENLPNIQKIIFQIYVFLTLVSDLEIAILNKHHYQDQIELIKLIKDVSKYQSMKMEYSSSSDSIISIPLSSLSLSSLSLPSPSSSSSSLEVEEEVNDEEMEEDTWDEVNTNNFSNKKNLTDIHTKESRIILLINDSEIHWSKDVQKNLNENQFFQNLKLQIDYKQNTIICCANVNEPDSYEKFLDFFNNALKSYYSIFSEVKTSFNAISFLEMSSSYYKIRCNACSWKKILKNMILDRSKELKLESSLLSENTDILISQLSNELAQITPFFDIEFINEYNSILSDLNSASTKLNRDLYANELEKSANSHLTFLNEKINENFFWTEEQMDLLTKSHFSFLRDEFYDIIQLTSTNQFYNIIYEENYDILENQKKRSKNKIDDIFKAYIEKLRIMKTPKEQDINEKIKKSANYCMKETENLSEIKVTVQIKKDLRNEIEQDF